MQTIKQTAAFARQAVTDLAKLQKSAIYSLRLDGKSIASLIVLKSDGVYYPWKIAFDQDYSRFSPGALLMYNVFEEIGSSDEFVRADSLASSTNQLVNLLWKQKINLGSLILPVGRQSQHRVDKVVDAIKRKQTMRNSVKRILKR